MKAMKAPRNFYILRDNKSIGYGFIGFNTKTENVKKSLKILLDYINDLDRDFATIKVAEKIEVF